MLRKINLVFLNIIFLPISLIIILLRPFVLLRFKELSSELFGGFIAFPEIYLCEKKEKINLPNKLHFDVFYPHHLGLICNSALMKIWRRKLLILPAAICHPINNQLKIISKFLNFKNNHDIGNNTSMDRDVHNLFDKYKVNISFNSEEKIKGEEFLRSIGLKENDKFVCVAVRDGQYNKEFYKDSFDDLKLNRHDYRNWNIQNFIPAIDYLLEKGYFVIRVGKNSKEKLNIQNKKFFDYTFSNIKNDFIDIFLGANCHFCISTGFGYDMIPHVFRRPVVFLGVPIGLLNTYSSKYLLLTKHHVDKKTKKKLTLSEIFQKNLAFAQDINEFENMNIKLLDCSSEEIKSATIEMIELIKNNFEHSDKNSERTKKFWSLYLSFCEDKKYSDRPLVKYSKIHGKILANISPNFLLKNQNLLN